MGINRYELVTRHNPQLMEIDYQSALTIGNGEFAFTADVTGLQTLYEEYKTHGAPLCTMSQWGWHSTPVNREKECYTLDDLAYTEYDYAGRKVTYAVEKMPGNEEVYQWLRQNPHRLNLCRLSLYYQGDRILPEDISDISQTLYLYEGILESSFLLHGTACRVKTCCHTKSDTIAIKVESDLLGTGLLSAGLSFPYGSPDISASNWDEPERHETRMEKTGDGLIIFKHIMDKTRYRVRMHSYDGVRVDEISRHEFRISTGHKDLMTFSLTFSENNRSAVPTVRQTLENCKAGWRDYWNSVGIVDLHNSKDPRATELERRIILSLYQSAVQDCGSLPPQETGLTCNSWHGKFHLEMYIWHLGYLPLWNRGLKLIASLDWYVEHLPQARENAARNGFIGARWPKQVAADGVDSPSPIAALLVWQQPHIIYMLEMLYKNAKRSELQRTSPYGMEFTSSKLLSDYWILIKETADFMADIAVYNNETKVYELLPPVIPAQESHDPKHTVNPIFEVEYWRFTLLLAVKWADRMGKEEEAEKWDMVARHMAKLPEEDGLYLAHSNCPSTYEKLNKDHPMMSAIYGFIGSDRVDVDIMDRTLKKTMECWDYTTMWGWDFAMMAMTAVRLGQPELAIDLLLMDTPNNQYAGSGNNTQALRKELPVYLPGNGSLLLAVAMMVAGFKGCREVIPGFPKNGLWDVIYEDIYPML